MVSVLDIRERRRSHPLSIASAQDFLTTPGGEAEPDMILRDPSITLYCLDDERQCALFVQTPDGFDFTAYPFLYDAQYEHATCVLVVPYEQLHALAARQSTLPGQLVFIHSVGRSGSTLLSKAFQEISTVASLSEPDAYTQSVRIRMREVVSDSELARLLRSSTRILFKPAFVNEATMCVVKFRSFCIEIADLLHSTFPDSRHIFLYRDLGSWITSSARAFLPLVENTSAERWLRLVEALASYLPLVRIHLREGGELPSPLEVLTLQWLSVVHRFAILQRDVPMIRLRYEDMLAAPARTLSTVLCDVGLPVDSADPAMRAFSRDSQEGSMLSREAVRRHGAWKLSEEERAQVRGLVYRYPLSCEDAAQLPDVVRSMDL